MNKEFSVEVYVTKNHPGRLRPYDKESLRNVRRTKTSLGVPNKNEQIEDKKTQHIRSLSNHPPILGNQKKSPSPTPPKKSLPTVTKTLGRSPT